MNLTGPTIMQVLHGSQHIVYNYIYIHAKCHIIKFCATIGMLGMHTVILVISIIIQKMINMTDFCIVNKKQEIGTLCW